ncbi:hypothetical protein BAUCODRAFT_20501 [Baudoinia panamericana UAMH 10762]|uniref:Uncharacterized protein n=1 Tax=Baudoinia panamericana (strain UAMH 10762) TaxID=717646 RepID=M2MTY3_BAUPA|nr:uncharacterized protein BAUCODRAFT_20501 [Baudoinia panamericana UAMH 10762]EMD00387.1 hypothetical protein BAUCODRAFT_20501 [Baudoinia panamericana UAMH 10762]
MTAMALPRLPTQAQSDYAIVNSRLRLIADEAYPYEAYDADGQIGHARAAITDLAAGISLIPNLPSIRLIEVYADTLTTQSPITLSQRVDELLIFARHIVVDSAISITVSSGVLVRFYCSSSCCPFNLRISTPKGQQNVTVNAPTNCQAVDVEIDTKDWSAIVSNTPEPPTDRFDVPSLADRILDKTLQKPQYDDKMNEHLPQLLRYQLLLAASWQRQEPETAFDIGTYVMKMTQRIPKAIDLYSRALTFAATPVIMNRDQLAAQADLVPVSSTKAILEAHLMAAKTFDDALRDFKGQEANASNSILTAKLALQASEDAEASYSFLATQAKARFDGAQASLNTAQKNFQDLELLIPAAQKGFQDGIEKWKIKHIAQVVVQGLVAVTMIVGSIAAACVVPPAGVGAAAGFVELPEITAEAANGIATVEHMVTVMDRLKSLYDKIKPGLEKIGQLVESIQAILALLVKMKHVNEADGASLKGLNVSVKEGDDLINMAADWDSFGTEMAFLYDPIKSENIEGGESFFLLVAKLVIRGKAVLTAQQAVTSTGDQYAAVLAQQLMATRSTSRLRAALPQIQGDPVALHLLRRDLFQRLVAVRTSIALDFKQYLDGLAWYALEVVQTNINLDPLKDIGEFYNDTATLQGAFARVSAYVRVQSRSFWLSTASGSQGIAASQADPAPLMVANAGSLAKDTMQSKTMTFSIDLTLPCFTGLGRIRMKSFSILLDGVAADYVSLRARLGEQMADLSLNSAQTDGVQTGVELQSAANRILHFNAAALTLGFAYSVDRQGQRTDLLSGDVDPAVSWPSPFRDWTITIDDRVDLAGLKSMVLRVDCDVSLCL